MRRPIVVAVLAAFLGTAVFAALPAGAQPAADGRPHIRPGRWDRTDRNWWRRFPEWRGYRGDLHGFWFAPGYGYVSVGPRLERHHWRRGEYVPERLRSLYVRDWVWFGLRAPPRGYAWVWCGHDIAMVSQGSGLVLDVQSDVF
jgi:Ni/Co efflux regulator RcnB